ncbi:MAG: hypothetical protein ACYS0G_07245 [Planctomycetota bacterium]|jgi:hypothetical protein
MFVHRIQLDKRPQGAGLISADCDQPVVSEIAKGWTVTLSYKDVRIQAQIVAIEEDQFYLGQVIGLDGYLESEFEGVRMGTYLRFREDHIFSCHR